MALEMGQHLLQLEEEALAGQVVVGEHVEFDPLQTSPRRGGFHTLQEFYILLAQQRGGRDGDGLVAC